MWGINQYQAVPPMQNMQARQQQFRGTWVMANSYQEAQTMALPMDGTPILVMLTDEQKFYLVSMQNGQRMISAFSFEVLAISDANVQNVRNSEIEERLARIEKIIGGMANEPNNKPVATTTKRK